ncbi:hypothetical protein TUM4438_36500 [Shewanella sairae]|uniref:Uncharacterized protein n=1 Tax=Shewanella sairae TaxID=190310 RepID=A0ABQ4PPH3_9GAMM|nr:hypothetical protein TUM4438_36500 [Shewanella sairae]
MTESNIFRTDRGDDEGHKEWDYLRVKGCKDKFGDDSVIIDFARDPIIFYEYEDYDCISSL